MVKQTGNIPRGYAERVEFDGWVLFEKSGAKPTSEWRSFKLVWCKRNRLAKANFWLGWNGERMAMTKDLEVLETHQPKLFQQLLHWLRADSTRAA